MLCIRGTSHGPVSVRPSVCPSLVGVLQALKLTASHHIRRGIRSGLCDPDHMSLEDLVTLIIILGVIILC